MYGSQRWSMPKINDLLRSFQGKTYITSLDLKSGYFHIRVRPEDRDKTAFLTPWGLFEWNRLPFGIKTAPMFFQKAMERVFRGLDFIQVYLDDVVVLSESAEEHVEHLKIVFERLRQYQLKLRLDKCKFGVQELEYLGHLVNAKTQTPTPKYKTSNNTSNKND